MRTRKAILPDAARIQALIAEYAKDDVLLPRTLPEVCENIRDFVVVEHRGRIIGCGALHLYGTHLAEIRSIAVDHEFHGRHAGQRLVKALLAEAEHQQVSCVCLFTRIPGFFAHMGFEVAPREALPDKMYKDCMTCPKLNACDEVPMVRGELPRFAILEEVAHHRPQLVTLTAQ
jgi:amino-acid N-acetyltransferase